jgi:hypothetical protein
MGRARLAPPRANRDGAVQFPREIGELHRGVSLSGDHQDVAGGWKVLLGDAEVLADQPLDAVSDNRIAHLAADGDPQAAPPKSVPGKVDHEVLRCPAHASGRRTPIIRAQKQAFLLREAPAGATTRGARSGSAAAVTSWRHER